MTHPELKIFCLKKMSDFKAAGLFEERIGTFSVNNTQNIWQIIASKGFKKLRKVQ